MKQPGILIFSLLQIIIHVSSDDTDKQRELTRLDSQIRSLERAISRECPGVANTYGIPIGRRTTGIDTMLTMARHSLSYLANIYTVCRPTTITTVSTTTTPVPSTTPTSCGQSLACDFDATLCGFIQDHDDYFDWTVNHGPTKSWSTGPSSDHTSGKGRYLYIEADGKAAGANALLLSPTLRGRGQFCISFWYHYYGISLGALTVYIRDSIKETKVFQKWEKSVGDQWNVAQVQHTVKNQFQVIFDGMVGGGYSSDIAIDDVDIYPGACIPFTEPPTIPPTTLTPFKTTRLFHCDFEHDLCNMVIDKPPKSTFNWTRTNGTTPSPHTGPMMGDHTIGTLRGHYVFTEASYTNGVPVIQGMKAWLTSPRLISNSQDGVCLEFWYNMNGDTMGTLNVGLDVTGIPIRMRYGNEYWSKHNATGYGDAWITHRVDINVTANVPFQFRFEGIRGQSWKGDMAVDDVSLYAGRCP